VFLSGGISAMSFAIAGPAYAQGTPVPADVSNGEDQIVVTGVRASVASALDLQRNATSLQQSIVAEDIGKLPSNNVVEALQNVTGVSIVRNNVEPSTVLIRGLPDVATTLSGRQIFTASSRSISLPDFPAELLSRVDVKKAPEADDIEGGIAGVINVELRRPFDFPGLAIAASAKGSYGSLDKKIAPQGSILLSNTFDTGIGEIGILVNAAYQKRTFRQDLIQNQNQPWRQFRPADNAGTGPAVGVPAGQVAYPGTVLLGQTNGEIKRTTIASSLQWAPSDTFEGHVDYFYAGLDRFTGGDVNVILMNTCPSPTGNKAFPGTNIGQVLPSGCYGLTSMQAREATEDTHQVSAGFDWDVSDRLTVTAQGNYTTSKDRVDSAIVDANYNYSPGGVVVTVNPYDDGGYVVDQPGDPQLSADHYLNQWYDIVTPRNGHEYSGRLDLNYLVSDEAFFRSVDVGYRYNTREATSDNAGTGLNCANTNGPGNGLNGGNDPFNKYRQLALNSEACTAYRAGSSPQPYTRQGAITSVGGISYADLGPDAYHRTRGKFFDGKYGTIGWVNLDQGWIFDNLETVRNLFGYSGQQDYIPSQHFDVTETSNAFYVKGNYGADFANGMVLDGNFGLRMVRTKLDEGGFSTAYVPLNPSVGANQGANATCTTCLVYTRTESSVTDTQWLPSFNARLELIEGLSARASFSNTVTRPTFAQLNPGETVNAATATIRGSVTSGNPNLSPIKSTNYDFDLTYYWGGANHIGGSIFYREVNGYIQTVTTAIVLDGLDYNLNRPENFRNATIKGIEVGYSQFLDFLPGLLGGFGWDANATYIDAPFNNVPEFSANLTGIYEKGPVSLRLSYTYSSPYLIGDFTGGVQPQQRWSSIRENMNLSANYSINDNLTVSFDVTNLLDNYQRQSAGKGKENERLYAADLSRFDTVYALGVRFRM